MLGIGTKLRASTIKRLLALACAALLITSMAPLYAIARYDHPYYDDFGFAKAVRTEWQASGDAGRALQAAWNSAKSVRETWQGTYTGTLLSNMQPGAFSERLYGWGAVFLLTAFLLGFGCFFWTVCRDVLGACRADACIVTSLLLLVCAQFLPNHSEAFFWFNGGVGNTFIYAMLFLSLALCLKLRRAQHTAAKVALLIALALLMTLLGGGSYGGGVLGLCVYACVSLTAIVRKARFRWAYTGLTLWFLVCFLYSMSAPGNAVRAAQIGVSASLVGTVCKALYYGVALFGSYVRLPMLAVGLAALPMIVAGVRRARFAFPRPWLVAILGLCLYCTQLTATLHSGVFLGGGRILDTYYESFVAFFFLLEIYVTGSVVKTLERKGRMPSTATLGTLRRALPIVCATLLVIGTIAWKRPNDALYGPQNTTGGSALASLLNGEARRYDAEMTAREAILNDETQTTVTLAPLSAVPDVFMEDPLAPGALYDAKPALCAFYGKDAILTEGGDAP